jgi:hypothetical protein
MLNTLVKPEHVLATLFNLVQFFLLSLVLIFYLTF